MARFVGGGRKTDYRTTRDCGRGHGVATTRLVSDCTILDLLVAYTRSV